MWELATDLELDPRSFRHSGLGLEVGAVYPVLVLERKENGLWTLLIKDNLVEAAAGVALRPGVSLWVRVNSIHPRVVLKLLSFRKGEELIM